MLQRVLMTVCMLILLCNTYAFANDSSTNQETIRVFGKIIEVNGKMLNLEVPPSNVNGTILVPVRPIFDALGLKLDWDSSNKTIVGTKQKKVIKLQVNSSQATVDNKSVMLEVPPQIISGNTMVPLRFLGESCDAKVDYTDYPQEYTRTIAEDEKSLKSAYNDALYTFNAETKNYNQDMNDYNNAVKNSKYVPKDDTPVYNISGQVISRDPFIVWGVAISYNAPPSDAGYVTSASNIKIENPHADNIMYGQYLQGAHYYKYTTTTKSQAGFNVPLYVFGDAPDYVKKDRANIQAQAQITINNAASIANATKKRLDDANDNLKIAKVNLENYIINHFESAINQNPNNVDVYLDYLSALFDSREYLKDTALTMEKVIGVSTKALNIAKNSNNKKAISIILVIQLRATDNVASWQTRIDAYKIVAEKFDPYILLNYVQSDYQKYDAAFALFDVRMNDKAEYLANGLKNSPITAVAKNAQSLLNQIKNDWRVIH